MCLQLNALVPGLDLLRVPLSLRSSVCRNVRQFNQDQRRPVSHHRSPRGRYPAALHRATSEFPGLRPDQAELFRLLGEGMRAAEIADHLGLSRREVRERIDELLDALGTPTQIEAVLLLLVRGR